jgi:hypothetical protein
VSIRILKYLRWFSLGMIMLVTGLVAYFFFFRGVPESNTRNPSTPALPVDITSSTREIEYIESRDGRPLFRVLARRNVAPVKESTNWSMSGPFTTARRESGRIPSRRTAASIR